MRQQGMQSLERPRRRPRSSDARHAGPSAVGPASRLARELAWRQPGFGLRTEAMQRLGKVVPRLTTPGRVADIREAGGRRWCRGRTVGLRAVNRGQRMSLMGRDVELVAKKTGPSARAGSCGCCWHRPRTGSLGHMLPLTAGGYLAAYLPASLAAIWLLFPHCRVTHRAACTSTKSS